MVTLRNGYATLSQQLEYLDPKKQAGQWARLYKHVKAAEAPLRQAEQDASPFPVEPPEDAKQQAVRGNVGGTAPPSAEATIAGERQEHLRIIASELISWREGVKVHRMAQFPK